MPDHDMNVGNDSGANVRTDLNDALSALVQNFSTATTPPTTFAHQIYADTSPSGYSIFKVRDAANAVWSTLWDDEGRWKGIDGTASEPSMSFGNDVDTGLYSIGANQLGITVGGSQVSSLTATTQTWLAQLVVHQSGAANRHTMYRTTNAPADIQDLFFSFNNNSAAQTVYAGVQGEIVTNVAGFEDGKLSLSGVTGGGLTKFLVYDGSDASITLTGSTIYTPVTITTDTTPTAAGRAVIIIGTWTAANDITDFDNETAGQRLTIIGGDVDCNVVDGAPIQLVAGAIWNGKAGATLELISDGTIWYELSRSDAS